jgi:hypothetical protein
MSRFPRAKSDGAVAAEVAHLDAQTAAILRLADGATSVEAMAEGLGTTREQVWAGLDRLYDWGLLDARLTPPAGAPLSRRGVLGTAARGAGWLGVASVAVAAPAFADNEHSREEASKHGHTATETREKSLAAKESDKKHRDRAEEQQNKLRAHASEEHEKRTDRAMEERKKHGGPSVDQADEQKTKRAGQPQ